jgi:signal transduction histidine kinase
VSGYLFPYLCLPFLVWSAFRFGQREVTTASLLLAIIALWGTMQGRGIFTESALGDDLLQGQGFMAFNSVMVLAVAAVVAQRREAEHVRVQLLRRLDEAQETERGRISRQLHDQLGQELTALKLGLQMVRQQESLPTDTRGRVGQLEALADDLMQNIHRLAWELHPAVLDDFGLETALRRYAEEWSHQSGISVDVQSYGMGAQRLPAEIETTLYRVMQEALTNVFRHAKAKRVGILLERRVNHVSLIVEDDGQGFDADAVMQATGIKGKLGLLGMKERITLAGGSLEVESAPGQGATVLVRIPLGQESLES